MRACSRYTFKIGDTGCVKAEAERKLSILCKGLSAIEESKQSSQAKPVDLFDLKSRSCQENSSGKLAESIPATTSTNGVEDDFSSLLVSWPLLAESLTAEEG